MALVCDAIPLILGAVLSSDDRSVIAFTFRTLCLNYTSKKQYTIYSPLMICDMYGCHCYSHSTPSTSDYQHALHTLITHVITILKTVVCFA